MPDTSKLEKLNRELEKSEKKLRKAINDEKALQHQLKQLTRKERTHRLCTRGGMLESFLQEPERLTDDDVMLLLKLIFHRQDTQELLKKLLEREKLETHKKDSESAPQTTVADELKENLEAVENFKGSRDEKLVVLYCKQLGINYKNLSDEEFRWLIRILKKSKKMGTPISQRKKR